MSKHLLCTTHAADERQRQHDHRKNWLTQEEHTTANDVDNARQRMWSRKHCRRSRSQQRQRAVDDDEKERQTVDDEKSTKTLIRVHDKVAVFDETCRETLAVQERSNVCNNPNESKNECDDKQRIRKVRDQKHHRRHARRQHDEAKEHSPRHGTRRTHVAVREGVHSSSKFVSLCVALRQQAVVCSRFISSRLHSRRRQRCLLWLPNDFQQQIQAKHDVKSMPMNRERQHDARGKRDRERDHEQKVIAERHILFWRELEGLF
jgi:hypothetical protein